MLALFMDRKITLLFNFRISENQDLFLRIFLMEEAMEQNNSKSDYNHYNLKCKWEVLQF